MRIVLGLVLAFLRPGGDTATAINAVNRDDAMVGYPGFVSGVVDESTRPLV